MSRAPAQQATFGADRLERIASLERSHFWFEGRRELLRRLMGGRLTDGTVVLDAGCGTGSMLVELRRAGATPVGVDALPDAVERARRTCPEARVELADVTALPFEPGSFDGAVLLDVLEHVDDRRALAEVARVLRPGGFVAVSVPACPRLWSRRDELAGHLRRYTRKRLVSRLAEAGLVVEKLTYYQLVLFPLFALARILARAWPDWVEREERIPSRLDRVFAAVNRAEARLAAGVSLPYGSSLVAIAVRR